MWPQLIVAQDVVDKHEPWRAVRGSSMFLIQRLFTSASTHSTFPGCLSSGSQSAAHILSMIDTIFAGLFTIIGLLWLYFISRVHDATAVLPSE